MALPQPPYAHNPWVDKLQRAIHPDHMPSGPFTCMASAPSKKRRCRRQISHQNHTDIHNHLEQLLQVSSDPLERRELLDQVADLSLCYDKAHREQKAQIVDRWCDAVAAEEQRLPDRFRERYFGEMMRFLSTKSLIIIVFMLGVALVYMIKPPTSFMTVSLVIIPIVVGLFCTFDPDTAKMRWMDFAGCVKRTMDPGEYYRHHAQHSLASPQYLQTQQEEARHEEARQEQYRQTKAHRQGLQERMLPEPDGQEQPEREEAHRRAEGLQGQRESETNPRRGQQTATWEEAWARYERGWANKTHINASARAENVKESLPWPVKSGRWQDVDVANVCAFLRRAPECAWEDLRAALAVLKAQALRWHPDRIGRHFPTTTGEGEVGALATLITQVINREWEMVR